MASASGRAEIRAAMKRAKARARAAVRRERALKAANPDADAEANAEKVEQGENVAIKLKSPHRWKKGESGNPLGRPKVTVEIRDLARMHGPDAIRCAVNLMEHRDPYVRLSAAKLILDRGYGKPMQPIANDGAPLVNVTLNTNVADAARVYASILGDPSISLDAITPALPDPVKIIEQPIDETPPPDEPLDMSIWEALAK